MASSYPSDLLDSVGCGIHTRKTQLLVNTNQQRKAGSNIDRLWFSGGETLKEKNINMRKQRLGQNLLQEIVGKTCMICKPVMKNAWFIAFTQEIWHLNLMLQQHNMNITVHDGIVKESSNIEKSSMPVSSEGSVKSTIERIRKEDLPAVNIPTAESPVKDKSRSVETVQSGMKRMALLRLMIAHQNSDLELFPNQNIF
ncbi:9726_t:CDS:2, partial [Cetraspora pellucida]